MERTFSKKEIKQLFWNSSKESRRRIRSDLQQLLNNFNPNDPSGNHGWDKQDMEKFKIVLAEFVKGGLKPGIVNVEDSKLADDDVAKARLVHHFHTDGYDENGRQNFDAIDSKMARPVEGNHGMIDLKERFGEIVPELSNSDYGVFRKPNGKLTVAFRGSQTNLFKNPHAVIEDWGYNALADFTKLAKYTPKYKRIIDNLSKLPLEDIEEFLGFSLGGGLAINVAEHFDKPSTVFNPHINRGHDLPGAKQNHHIIRTSADPASRNARVSEKVKISSIAPVLNYQGGGVDPHNLLHFATTKQPRDPHNRLITKSQATEWLGQHLDTFQEIEELEQLVKKVRNPREMVKTFMAGEKDFIPKLKAAMRRRAQRPAGAIMPQQEMELVSRTVDVSDPRPTGRIGFAEDEPGARRLISQMTTGPRRGSARSMVSGPTERPLVTRDLEPVRLRPERPELGSTGYPRRGSARSMVSGPTERSLVTQDVTRPQITLNRIRQELARGRGYPVDPNFGRALRPEELTSTRLPRPDQLTSTRRGSARQFVRPEETSTRRPVAFTQDSKDIQRVIAETTTGMNRYPLSQRGIASLATLYRFDRSRRARVMPFTAQEIFDAEGNGAGSVVHPKTALEYALLGDDERAAVRYHLQRQYMGSLTDMDREYLLPARNSNAMGGFNVSNGGLAAVGILSSSLTDMLLEKAGIGANQPSAARDFIEGASASLTGDLAIAGASGVLSQSAGQGASFTRNALTGVADLARSSTLVSGAVGAGVGLMAGNAITRAIEHGYGPGPLNVGQEALAQLGGQEAGVAIGTATTAAVSAAAVGGSAVLAGEGTMGALAAIGAADFWNPVGWGALIGAGITASVVGVNALIQGVQESKDRINTATKNLAMSADNHALKAAMTQEGKELGLREQYSYIIEYLKSIGAAPTTIAKAQEDLQNKLDSGDSGAFNQKDFTKVFKTYLGEFNAGLPPRNLDRTVAQYQNARLASLNNLVARLKANGIKVDPPPATAGINNLNYAGYYNNIVAGLTAKQKAKVGVNELPAPNNPFTIQGNQLTTIMSMPAITASDVDPQVQDLVNDLQFRAQVENEEAFYKDKPNLAEQTGFTQFYQRYEADLAAEQRKHSAGALGTVATGLGSVAGTIGSALSAAARIAAQHQGTSSLGSTPSTASLSSQTSTTGPPVPQYLDGQDSGTVYVAPGVPRLPKGLNYVPGHTLSRQQVATMSHHQLNIYMQQQNQYKLHPPPAGNTGNTDSPSTAPTSAPAPAPAPSSTPAPMPT